jgi:hypothetical protein
MQTSHAVALLTIAVVLVVWVAVQNAWRRSFAGACSDPDVLAGRGGCKGCDSTEACDRRRAGPAEEEV